MKVKITQKGDFRKYTEYTTNLKRAIDMDDLDNFGREGVLALRAATPVDTGLTADSWYYEIVREKNSVSLVFKNSNVQSGVPIAVILQYGHATRNGGYVEGIDYINPALRPIFEEISQKLWRRVKNS